MGEVQQGGSGEGDNRGLRDDSDSDKLEEKSDGGPAGENTQ